MVTKKQNFNILSNMSIVLNYLKLQKNHKKIFQIISEVENFIFGINKLSIDQNLFVCGMPRSGTTFLTHLLNSSNEFSTFKYKDLPFYSIPIFWNYFNKLFYFSKKKFRRVHGDNLFIDKFSPDSFEELIWKNNIPQYNKNGYWQNIDKNYSGTIDKSLQSFIKKVNFINKKKKYLSKNNNNIFRIKYLLSKFPNSKIILLIRDPIDTALSLTKVHLKFLKFHKLNEKFSEELKLLGHEEFGYYRKLFKLNDDNNKIHLKNNASQIKLYIKKCLELNSFIIKNYIEEIENGKIIVVDFNNIKKFEDALPLLKKLKIDNINLIKQYFDENFKLNIYKNNIDKKKYEELFENYKTLQKYSLV